MKTFIALLLIGSKFSPTSIHNEFGVYGSRFSQQSPNNPYGGRGEPPQVEESGDTEGLLPE